MKTWKLALVASAIAVSQIAAGSASAESASIQLDEGKLENGRLLIPLRAVSEKLGAQVEWDQTTKRITISTAATTMSLTLDSKTVTVDGSTVTLDTAPKLFYGGSTFVPLRFVSQTLGADVSWSQTARQATITTAERQIVVGLAPEKIELPSSQRISNAQAAVFVKKLNEATELSSISQIRMHFKPYFSDTFINQIIQSKGLAYNYEIKEMSPYPVTYTDTTTARLSQWIDIGRNDYGDVVSLVRIAQLKRANGVWKVDSVAFQKTETPISP